MHCPVRYASTELEVDYGNNVPLKFLFPIGSRGRVKLLKLVLNFNNILKIIDSDIRHICFRFYHKSTASASKRVYGLFAKFVIELPLATPSPTGGKIWKFHPPQPIV